jgi:peptidoglycan L-alanyl-D-glutamate endopeptidase CwlK
MTVFEHYLNLTAPVLASVHPILRDRATSMMKSMVYEDLYFAPFQGLRTFVQQAEDYAKGRTTPGKIVTKARAGESLHNYGLAIDWAEDADPSNDKGIQWSWKKTADYMKLGSYAKAVGLEWGGLWKAFVDIPHVELTGGLTLRQIQYIYAHAPSEPIGAVWKAVTDALIALDHHEGIV